MPLAVACHLFCGLCAPFSSPVYVWMCAFNCGASSPVKRRFRLSVLLLSFLFHIRTYMQVYVYVNLTSFCFWPLFSISARRVGESATTVVASFCLQQTSLDTLFSARLAVQLSIRRVIRIYSIYGLVQTHTRMRRFCSVTSSKLN